MTIPDGTTGKTLLDATVIYWFNRHGDGDSHSNRNVPNISIANSMGVTVPSFGKDAWIETTPLAGLTG